MADGVKFRIAQRASSRRQSKSCAPRRSPGLAEPSRIETRSEAALGEARSKLKPAVRAESA